MNTVWSSSATICRACIDRMKFSRRVKGTKKLKGTIELLKQALFVIFITSLVGLMVSQTLSYALGLIIFGVCIFAIGGITISFRRVIWDSYAKMHHNKKGIIGFLTNPTKFSYWLNIALVWPLVMIFGIIAVVIGVLS